MVNLFFFGVLLFWKVFSIFLYLLYVSGFFKVFFMFFESLGDLILLVNVLYVVLEKVKFEVYKLL